MGKRMVSLLICLVMMMPIVAFAEEKDSGAMKMEELGIQVMPEFAKHPKDKETKQPPLLIGYQGSLINNSSKAQKGKIEIPLPMEEKNFRIGFVADYSSDLSQMYEIEYELDMKKGTISWETSRDIEPGDQYKFVIEFYTDALKTKNGTKTLEYTFKSFADITMVNITVLEPMNASKFKMQPAATETPHQNSYGLKMHTYQLKNMKAGKEQSFKLSYNRTETRTTSELMNEKTGKAAPAKALKAEKMPLGLMIGGISAASLLVAGLLILFLKRRQQRAVPEAVPANREAGVKKAQLRRMLVEGSITEQEYNDLLKKLNL